MITIIVSIIIFESCTNPKPIPIPKDREAFIGKWVSTSGFQIEIKSSGTANIKQILNSQSPDYDKLNIKVAPLVLEEMLVTFERDSILTISKPRLYAKEFLIKNLPFTDEDSIRIILNGVVLTKK
jgi:hypothetical protein